MNAKEKISKATQSNKKGFPLKFFAVLFFLSVTLVSFSAIQEGREHATLEGADTRHMLLVQNIGRATFLDEALTMSARMAAATGDLSYETRFNQLDAELATTISSIRNAIPEQEQLVNNINNINLALVKIEREAFELTHQNKQKEALALLAGQEYMGLKKEYLDAIEKITVAINTLINNEEKKLHGATIWLELANIAGSGIILIVWLLAFRATRRWNKTQEELEGALQASSYTRSLIEASLDPFVTISPEGAITDVNEATVLATGAPREALIGSDFSNYFTEPDRARDGYKEVFMKGSITDYPLSLRHTSGRTIDVLYNASIYRNQEGNVIGVFAAARNVTERKQAEETLRTLVEHSPVAMVIDMGTGINEKIIILNRKFTELFGYTIEDVPDVSHLWSLAYPDENHRKEVVEEWTKRTAEAIRTHGQIEPMENTVVCKDGSKRYIRFSLSSIGDRNIITFEDLTKDKKTEESIRKNEAELKEAQRIGNFGNFDWDARTDVITWSEGYYRIYGFNPEQKPPQYEDHLKTYTPESAARLDAVVKNSMATGEPYVVDLEHMRPDGTRRWITVRGEVKRDEHGAIIGLHGTAQDITEHKVAEIKTKQLSFLYSTLSQCNQAIIHSNNKEELFMQVCRAAVQPGGFKMAWIGLVDETSNKVIPIASYGDTLGYLGDIQISTDENDPFGRGPTGTAIRKSEPFWCPDFQHDPRTTPWHKRGAESGWVSSAALPFYQKGITIGALTIYSGETKEFDEPTKNLLIEMMSDISYALDTFIDKEEKKRVEKDIKERKAQDEAIMESLGEGLIAVNKLGKVISMNHKAEEITGWGQQEIIGNAMVDTIQAVDKNGEKILPENRPISIVLNTSIRFASDTLYFIQKNGQTVPVAVTATPVILKGELIGAVVIFRDMTKEKEIEKTREDLLSLASHQLRTPLSGTKWLIETLKKGIHGPLTDSQEEYLDEIYRINERMTSLVQDMLSVLRIESGVISETKTHISTKEITETLLKSIEILANEKLIKLTCKDESLDYSISSDPLLLHNILDILVSNSISYSPPGSEVVVSVVQEGGEVIFAVKDSGIGIPRDEQGRLFERFYRASNAKISNTKGTGLGLYIAATLARKIGATLSFESEEGKGSTFYVHIPNTEGINSHLPGNTTSV